MDLLDQAKQFAQEGKYEAALGLFREAGGASGHYGAAACLHRLGRDHEAEAEVRRCLELVPGHPKARDLLDRISGQAARDQLARGARRLAAGEPAPAPIKKPSPGEISLRRMGILFLLLSGAAVLLSLPLIILLRVSEPNSQETIQSRRRTAPALRSPVHAGKVKRRLGYIDKSNIVDMPVWKKQKIYYDVASFQHEYDAQHLEDYAQLADRAVADRYDITLEAVKKITLEGGVSLWPIPTALPPQPRHVAIGQKVPFQDIADGLLQNGVSYRIVIPPGKNVPLCPATEVVTKGMSGEQAARAAALAIDQIRYIPSGSVITLRGQKKDGTKLWFLVDVEDAKGRSFGSGWINGIVLIHTEMARVK